MPFTPRAQKAFRFAKAESDLLSHPCVGSHHLVLGLLLLGDGVQFSVLRKLGCSAESVRQSIASGGALAEPTSIIDGDEFGSSAVAALNRASDEAERMNHTYTGTEHILLGLLAEEKGPAATLFSQHRADKSMAREMILREYW